jgi:hypothetical protein
VGVGRAAGKLALDKGYECPGRNCLGETAAQKREREEASS